MKAMRLSIGGLGRWHLVAESALLERALPRYEVASRHQVVVRAPAAMVYAAFTRLEPGRAPLARVLMALRAVPGRLASRRPRSAGAGKAAMTAIWGRFLVLADQPGQERVLGLAGQFWRPSGNLATLPDVAAWQAYRAPGTAKAALTLRVEPIDHQTSRLYTETRVHTHGRRARRLFRVYWLVIGPFSGLLRRSLLRQVKTDAEQAAGLFRLTA